MKTKPDKINFITLFRSGQIWEIDIARDALSLAKIPHFVREETLSGVISAFHPTPAPGVGVTWCLLVPDIIIEDAKLVLSELPIDLNKNPDYWDFTSDFKSIKSFKYLIWIYLAILGLVLIFILLYNLL